MEIKQITGSARQHALCAMREGFCNKNAARTKEEIKRLPSVAFFFLNTNFQNIFMTEVIKYFTLQNDKINPYIVNMLQRLTILEIVHYVISRARNVHNTYYLKFVINYF